MIELYDQVLEKHSSIETVTETSKETSISVAKGEKNQGTDLNFKDKLSQMYKMTGSENMAELYLMDAATLRRKAIEYFLLKCKGYFHFQNLENRSGN